MILDNAVYKKHFNTIKFLCIQGYKGSKDLIVNILDNWKVEDDQKLNKKILRYLIDKKNNIYRCNEKILLR